LNKHVENLTSRLIYWFLETRIISNITQKLQREASLNKLCIARPCDIKS